MDDRPSNDALLRELREGTAHFELLQPPAPCQLSSAGSSRSLFFARIGSPMSPAMKKLEHYTVEKVTGDGRCMFRALVKGMARNKGLKLSAQQEKTDADELRMAVKEVICDSESERLQYEEALVAITCEESLKRYCKRIERPDFWGGESELLHAMGSRGPGFIPIAEYGSEFRKASKGKPQPRTAVRLLYSGKNHYDLLV